MGKTYFGKLLYVIFILTCFAISFNVSIAQTGYIRVTAEPIDVMFQFISEDSSHSRETTTAIPTFWSAPANHTYTIYWQPEAGYNTPSSETAYLFTDDTIYFHGVYTPVGSPNAPSNLSAAAIPYNKVNLSWQDNSGNEDNFIIERRLFPNPAFSIITSVGINVASYQDSSVSPDTIYFYRVSASNSMGTSAPSAVAEVTTVMLPPGPPDANFFTNMTSLFSGMSVLFSDASLYPETWDWDFGDGYSLSFQNPSHLYVASDPTTYNARLIATNPLGSDTVFQTIYIGLPPENFSLSTIIGPPYGHQLSWEDRSNNEINFELFRKEGVDPYSLTTADFSIITTLSQNETTYNDFGVDTSVGLNSTYFYAYNLRAISADTVSSFVSIGPSFAVASFYSLPSSGFSSFGVLTVQFADLSLNATEWYWDFGDGNNFIGQNPGKHLYNSSTNAIFYSRLSVNNTLGFGSELMKAIFINLPPTNLNAAGVSSTQIQIGWLDNANYETGFEIWRQVSNGPFSLYSSASPNSTDFTDTGLLSGTEYGYRVRATTYQAVSEFTNDVTAQTTTPIRDWYMYDSGIMVKHMPGTIDGVLPNSLYRELKSK